MMTALALLLGSLSVCIQYSSPNGHVWENEILLGANDTSFFTLKTCKYWPETYYANVDSVFLLEKSISTGKILEKHILRVISNWDATSLGDWQLTDKLDTTVNITAYLTAKKAGPVYQKHFTGMAFEFTPAGMLLNYQDKQEQIADKSYIDGFIDWFAEYISYQEAYKNDLDFRIRVSQAYQSSTHIFLVVETGADQADTDFRQTLLAIDLNRLNAVKQKIRRKN